MAEKMAYTNIKNIPEIIKLARQVRTTGKPRALRIDGEDIAVLIPPSSPMLAKAKKTKQRDTSGKDVLLKLLNMHVTGGPNDLSANIDHYLYGAPKKDA